MGNKQVPIITMLAADVLFAVVFAAAAAPILAPNDPQTTAVDQRLAGPDFTYPLGTDTLGRCLLSRLLFNFVPPSYSAAQCGTHS